MKAERLKERGFELFLEREMCQNRIAEINQQLNQLTKVMQNVNGTHDAERLRADEDGLRDNGGPVEDDKGDDTPTE